MALTKIPASLLDTSGGFDLQGNITLGDEERIIFGTDSDLQIYHSGSDSYIRDTGSGTLRLTANAFAVWNAANNENMIVATENGAVTLYYDNSPKIATSSTGATVTGNLAVTGDLDITGNVNSASVTDLDVTDKTITLGAGQTEALSGGSGIIIDGSGASILWDETNTEWDFNSIINAPSVFSQYYSIRESGTQYGFIGQYKTLAGTGTDTSLTIFSETGDGINFAVNGSITKAVVIDTEGDVGIGATSPTDKLVVAGALRLTANISFDSNKSGRIYKASNHGLAFHGVTGTENDFAMFNPAGQLMVVNPTGTNNVSLIPAASGNVGIGTNNPGEKLEVAGNIDIGLNGIKAGMIGRSASSSADANINFWDYNHATFPGHVHIVADSAGSDGTYNAGQIMFWTHNGSAFNISGVIDKNGNFGIGATNPAAPLEVQKSVSGNFVARFQNTNATTPYGVWIKEPASAANAYPSFQVTDSAGTTTRFRVDSGTGNVGIGTGSPTEKLEVVGSIVCSDFTDEEGIFFRSGFSNNNKYNVSIMAKDHNGNAADGLSINGYDGISFCTGSNSRNEVMRIVGGSSGVGNVGIGTENPSTKLHVHSSSSPEIRATTELDSNTPTMQIGYSSGSGYFLRLPDAANNEDVMIRSYGDTVFNGGGEFIINNVKEYYERVFLANNASYTFDIDVKSIGASGQVLEVFAGYTHYATSYGAVIKQVWTQRSTGQSDVVIVNNTVNLSTAAGGSWTFSYVDADTVRLTKSAGTYSGSGWGYILIRSPN